MSGRSSTSGMATGAAPRGGQQQGSEDDVHETPEYLRGDYGYFDPDLPPTAPPVFGDDSQ